MPDGTLVVEARHFDPVAGRIEIIRHRSGPGGSAHEPVSSRRDTASELARLQDAAGLGWRSA